MRRRVGFLFIVIFILVVPFGMCSATDPKIVLVTGFEPFGMYPTNPSQVIAETLNGSTLNDAEIIGIVLPVNFTASVVRAIEAVELYHPDMVISLGLNAKAKVIEVEKSGSISNDTKRMMGAGRFPSGLIQRVHSYESLL